MRERKNSGHELCQVLSCGDLESRLLTTKPYLNATKKNTKERERKRKHGEEKELAVRLLKGKGFAVRLRKWLTTTPYTLLGRLVQVVGFGVGV